MNRSLLRRAVSPEHIAGADFNPLINVNIQKQKNYLVYLNQIVFPKIKVSINYLIRFHFNLR